MFRFSLVVCVSLILCITAKPYKPWNKLKDEAFQDTVMSMDDKGKMSWAVEVEPPEDMDETGYDVDPSMRIWKNMRGSGQDKQPLKAEEDLDELRHPSVVDLLKVQTQNMDADIPAEPWQEVANMKYDPEPEPDMDEVYHKALEEVQGYLAPLRADYKADEASVKHSEPEEDEDEMYHHDDQSAPVQMEQLSPEVIGESDRVRVHFVPEEDMDDLYHRDDLLPVYYQEQPEAAAPAYLPSERKYSEPEEDLDDLYHQ